MKPNLLLFGFLQNSTWYLVITFSSVALAFFLPGWSWLPWLISIAWGAGVLAYHLFGQNNPPSDLQVYLNRATAYKKQINETINTVSNKNERLRLQRLATQTDCWVETIQELVERIINLRQNPIIWRDLAEAPKAIEGLQARLARETDTTLQTQLMEALSNYQKQFTALTELQNTIKRAEIQIESTVSMLGTIYSQLLTSQSTDHVADYNRFAVELDEQVNLLQDQLAALREVKLGERE